MENWAHYTYTLVTALVLLVSYITFSIVRDSARKKRSLIGGSARVRGVVVVVLVLAACFMLIENVYSIRDGVILVAVRSKYSVHAAAFKIHRADNPEGFWGAVFGYSYMSLVFLYFAGGEIYCSLKEKKALEHAGERFRRSRHKR